jgi:hypothetical protein
MAKYSKTAQKTVKEAMHKKKRGRLKSGGSGKKVKSRKQAIAIGLAEARKKGAKVPPPPRGSKSAGKPPKKKRAKKRAKKKAPAKHSKRIKRR